MIELGKKQKLTVVKSVDFGVYLGEDMQADAKNRVLLPSRQVPEGTKEGDSIEALSTRILRIVLLQQQKNRSFR